MSATVRVLVAAAATAATAVLAPPAEAIEQTAPLSENGRYRAYQTGMNSGVKVTDRAAGGTDFVSVDSDGRWQPAERQDLDDSGRHVVFQTRQPLVVDDVNLYEDVYVRDRGCPYSDRIGEGGTVPGISPDGRFVGFFTNAALDPADEDHAPDLYVVDRATDEADLISVGNPGDFPSRLSHHPPALSRGGRYVAFATHARLTPDDTDGEADVYRRDRLTNTTQLASTTSLNGTAKDAGNPSISADGNTIAFDWIPPSTPLRQAWVRDMGEPQAHSITEWPVASSGRGSDPSVSADGSVVAFTGNPLWNDEGQNRDIDSIYLHDRTSHTTYGFPKQDPHEQQRVPDISANGRFISWSNPGTTGGVYDRGPGSERPALQHQPYEPACKPAKHSAYRSAVIDDAPLSYFRFGEQPGTWTTHDEMHPTPDYWMDAILGATGALANDPNRAITLAGRHTVALDRFPFAGRDSFSLEGWIRPRKLDSTTRRVFSNEGRGDQGGYLVGVRSDGIVFSRYAAGRWSTLKAPITPNRWTHVVATFDGTKQVMRLYLDGARAAVAQSTLLIPPIENFDRGLDVGSLRGRFRFFVGEIDEAAIYDKALQPERVAAHHRLGGGTA